MQPLTVHRYSLTLAAASLLAACGGLQPQIGSPGTLPLLAERHSSSSEGLIYGFNHDSGFIIDYPTGKAVSSFTTGFLNGPACSDDQGNVYLGVIGTTSGTITDLILKYPYGATKPSGSQNLGFTPVSCSVDNATGNVAVAVHSPYWAVEVLPGFSGPGKIYRAPGGFYYRSVGYDGSRNLFAFGTTSNGGYFLAEMPKLATSFSQISLNLGMKIAYVRNIEWDGSYMAIEATVKKGRKAKDYPQKVFRIAVSGSTATVVGTSTFNHLNGESPTATSWIEPNLDIFAYGSSHITIWNYPAGGKDILNLKPKAIGGPVYSVAIAAPST